MPKCDQKDVKSSMKAYINKLWNHVLKEYRVYLPISRIAYKTWILISYLKKYLTNLFRITSKKNTQI